MHWSVGAHIVIFATAWWAGAISVFPYVEFLELRDPPGMTLAAWAVLAGFASIAFAGLAVLMQATSEPVVTSRSVRAVLFRHSQFRPILAFSIVGVVHLGIGSLFLDQSESAAIEVAVVVSTVVWIGISYSRVARVYTNPGEALRLGTAALVQDLKRSMREAGVRREAERRLHAVIPRLWSRSRVGATSFLPIVEADRAAVLADVNIVILEEIVDALRSGSLGREAGFLNQPISQDVDERTPELRMLTSIGYHVDAGETVVALVNSDRFRGELAPLRNRLRSALVWDNA